jgi:hypothetical protein
MRDLDGLHDASEFDLLVAPIKLADLARRKTQRGPPSAGNSSTVLLPKFATKTSPAALVATLTGWLIPLDSVRRSAPAAENSPPDLPARSPRRGEAVTSVAMLACSVPASPAFPSPSRSSTRQECRSCWPAGSKL